VAPVLFFLVVSKIFISISKRKGYVQIAELSFLSNPKIQVAIFMLFLTSIINLGFTYSRGAWAGFILCFFLLGFGGKKSLLASMLVVVIFSVVFYPKFNEVRLSVHRPSAQGLKSVSGSPLAQAPVQDGPEWQKTLGAMGFSSWTAFKTYNNRLGYWSRSMRIIRDYPLLGTGINTYSVVQWEYSEGWGGYPHNSYLQMTAETGVLGLFSFLWLLFVLYKNLFRALRKMQESNLKILLIGFGAGLLGFLLHSFFDTNFYSVQLSSLMWLIMGVVVAIQHMGTNEGLDLHQRH
jgi:O-antigen ligase